MASLKYEDRYVVFIDILGFSELIRKTTDQDAISNLIISIEQIAKSVATISKNMRRRDARVQTFSDCIVMSFPNTKSGLQDAFESSVYVTTMLMTNGMLVRGGLTKGKIHHSEKSVFGPAFLAAYSLETTIAIYPRIVIDRSVHEDFRSFSNELKITLRSDN